MTTDPIPALLEPIQNRLNAADKEPSRWLTGNDGNPVYYQSLGAKAEFIAAAPTDQARLLAAVQAVVAEIADTDLETNEAQQGDLADRILAAVEAALRGEA